MEDAGEDTGATTVDAALFDRLARAGFRLARSNVFWKPYFNQVLPLKKTYLNFRLLKLRLFQFFARARGGIQLEAS